MTTGPETERTEPNLLSRSSSARWVIGGMLVSGLGMACLTWCGVFWPS